MAITAPVSAGPGLPVWLSITTWILLGTSMILFNKMLLTTWGFHYVFFLTGWHCVLATILTQVLSRTTSLLPGVAKGTVTWSHFMFRIVPMSVLFVISLVLGNMAYSYISLAYIQMVKAFTPVPLLLLSFVAGLERPSIIVFCIVVVISAGVTMSSVGELKFSAVGFFIQISAVFADCFRMIILNLALKDLGLDSLSLLYYTAPPSALMLVLGFFLFEAQTFDASILTFSFSVMLFFNGLLAFSLNIAAIYLIGSTSAVVIAISGPLKDILIVLISVCLFNSPVTLLQIFGFGVSLAGLNMYREYKADPKRAIAYCSAMMCITNPALVVSPTGESDAILSQTAARLSHSGGSSVDGGARRSEGDLELQGLLEEEK